MKLVAILILLGALAMQGSASTVVSWTQADIPGHNLTLNYTSSFNVVRDDILGISIKNIGIEAINDTIMVNKINVSDTSKAQGSWTGSLVIEPNSGGTVDLVMNMTTDDSASVGINIYYNVSSDHRTLGITAHYPGTPEITSWGNSKSNDNSRTLTVNTSEVVRFNATADQQVDSWNWYRDNVKQSNVSDNFSASWDAAGTRTISVNATNANGTSDTLTWTVTVNTPSGGPAPVITSWSNSKTNNSDLNLVINETETVKFNFTANQTLTSWLWTLNGNSLSNPKDNLTHTFNNAGSYKVGASGSNGNGSTRSIVWNMTVLEKEGKKKNATLLSWYPQVVDYVYVNDTVSETIEYSITTADEITTFNWSVDGRPVIGDADGNTYYYTHTWANNSVGFHTVIFKGSNTNTRVEFRWYVNVYEIDGYRGGNLFDVIDDALENHVTDIKIRMFKYKIAKNGGKSAISAQKVNQLHDEIAKRQMTREALRKEFKAGNITVEQYVAAIKQVQRDAKYNSKLAKEYAKIAKEDLKDEKTGKELEKISELEKTEKGQKDKDANIKGKSKGKLKDNENKENGKGKN